MKALHLTREEFAALPEYSCTLPTGTTPGKRWRAQMGFADPEGTKPRWYVGEYGAVSSDGRSIAINWYIPVMVIPGSGMVSGEII